MMNTTLTTLNLRCVMAKKENKCNRMKKQKEKYEIMKNCTGNNIGAEGAIKISESLIKNTTLTALNLGCVIGKRELM